MLHTPRFLLLAATLVAASFSAVSAAPIVSRLTPPSDLFSFKDPNPPYISRFVPGQRFDLQATISPDAPRISPA
jgi:alkaline phosphatase